MAFVVDEVATGQVVPNVPVLLCHSHFTKTLCTLNYLSRTSHNINIHIKFIIIIIICTSSSSFSMEYNQKINTKETEEPCTTNKGGSTASKGRVLRLHLHAASNPRYSNKSVQEEPQCSKCCHYAYLLRWSDARNQPLL